MYTLLDVLDAARDLHQTLINKEQRDYEQSLRSKGYPSSRRIEYVEDERLGSDDTIVLDKAAVTRQFENGYQALGVDFAIGDGTSCTNSESTIGHYSTFTLHKTICWSEKSLWCNSSVISQTALQSQIITLQSVLLATFLYGPSSSDPVSHHLAKISTASRAAGTASVDILAALQRRQQDLLPAPRSTHSLSKHSSSSHAPPYPVTTTGTSTPSTALTPYNAPTRARSGSHPVAAISGSVSTAPTPYNTSSQVRSGSPVNTTVLEWRGRPKPERTDTDTTSMTGPTSHGTQSSFHDVYCLYAVDLQRHHTQPLSASVTSDSVPHCPHCKTDLHLSSGKAWEISKEDDGFDRCFQVANRFVVKCHRDGPDGQYACVLCSDNSSVHTICGDVKALIKHIWEDHTIRELKREVDISEVIEQPSDRRRDSGLGYDTSRGSRKSASLVSSRRRRSLPAFEHEVDVFDMRPSRRVS